MSLKDKVVIITGGGQGIGKAYVEGFCKKGAKVVIAEINLEKAREVEKELTDMGGEVLAIKVDVSNEEETKMMAEKTIERFGRIDVLINNAAIYAGLSMKPFDTISVEEWDRVFEVNVKGEWLCIKAVVPQMKRQGSGKIINISSGSWFIGAPMLLHYVTSKAAIAGLTRAISRELGEFNINVNTIAPGFTMSDASINMDGMPPGMDNMIAQQTALRRNEMPEDLVGAAIFLASDASDFITGQLLNVDGGMVMH